MFKLSKKILVGSLITALVVGVAGYVTLGTGFGSYVRSSVGLVKTKVKDSIPIEFEIQRAKDLVENLIPEMRANLRIVAAEDVEVANLEKDLEREQVAVEDERTRVHKLRRLLQTEEVTYRLDGRNYDRQELVDSLGQRFDHLKMAEKFLEGKRDLLRNRKRSLAAAKKKLEKTRLKKIELEAQIGALEEQFRLIEMQASGSEFALDETGLGEAERVIKELRKRFDIAQKVMAQEARFVDSIPLDTVDEISVFESVDAYFAEKEEGAVTRAAVVNNTDI